MLLPHHPEALAALRKPTADAPWRVLISGCIAGWPVTTDGTTSGMDTTRPTWMDGPLVELVPFCPEDHGLGTPRAMPDLHDGDGFAVLRGEARMLDPTGEELTERVLAGCRAMAALALSAVEHGTHPFHLSRPEASDEP